MLSFFFFFLLLSFGQLLTEDEPQSNREGQEEVDDERQQFTRTATSEYTPTIEDIEDQLSRASLNTTDLKNINPQAAFPETDSKSLTESKSEYPFSSIGRYSLLPCYIILRTRSNILTVIIPVRPFGATH